MSAPSRSVSVRLLPQMCESTDLEGAVAVVIDLLRASTTITTALAAGASAVIPCREVDEARDLAARFSDGEILLGGERGGELIEGFDLDNSPAAYTPARVAGKTILFTTTNGTAAIETVAAAERVLIGCFANLNMTLDVLIRYGRPVRLICAGTNGQITTEDVLCAGALATGLWRHFGCPDVADDQTTLAMALYESASKDAVTFLRTLRNSRGGRNLQRIGMDADIVIASKWDHQPVLPEFNTVERTLLPAADANADCEVRLHPPE